LQVRRTRRRLEGETRLRRAYVAAASRLSLERSARARHSVAAAAVRLIAHQDPVGHCRTVSLVCQRPEVSERPVCCYLYRETRTADRKGNNRVRLHCFARSSAQEQPRLHPVISSVAIACLFALPLAACEPLPACGCKGQRPPSVRLGDSER
jgi:hypothetical protein